MDALGREKGKFRNERHSGLLREIFEAKRLIA